MENIKRFLVYQEGTQKPRVCYHLPLIGDCCRVAWVLAAGFPNPRNSRIQGIEASLRRGEACCQQKNGHSQQWRDRMRRLARGYCHQWRYSRMRRIARGYGSSDTAIIIGGSAGGSAVGGAGTRTRKSLFEFTASDTTRRSMCWTFLFFEKYFRMFVCKKSSIQKQSIR